MKKCLSCGETKPLDAFPVCSSAKDGRYTYCRNCQAQRIAYYRSGGQEGTPPKGHWGKWEHHTILECSKCGIQKPVAEFRPKRRGYKQPCRACESKLRCERRLSTRLKVIQAYGGQCACCDEQNQAFLCIDHIYNDGYLQRKDSPGFSGDKMYSWLLKQGCPKERFQLLCYNCNGAKAIYGQCPHTPAS
jgi:hypothetical protein